MLLHAIPDWLYGLILLWAVCLYVMGITAIIGWLWVACGWVYAVFAWGREHYREWKSWRGGNDLFGTKGKRRESDDIVPFH